MTMSSSLAISTTNLTKVFGSRPVVDSLSLEIPRGVISGFVGPNGAGKTTTMRMLLGLIAPTSGSAEVLGGSLREPASYLGRVGALIEAPAFYPQLSGRENLRTLAVLGGLPLHRVDESLQRVGLSERAQDRFGRYSLGMKQRLGIAAALLPQPELLVLDEPTNGLDPAGIVEMRNLIRSFADEGMTVFVSSHLLSEIEQICNHLVMIRTGHLVYQGHVDSLYEGLQQTFEIGTTSAAHLGALIKIVEATDLAVVSTSSAFVAELSGDESDVARLNSAAVAAGIPIIKLGLRPQTLEDAYFTLTGTHSGDVPTSQLGGVQS